MSDTSSFKLTASIQVFSKIKGISCVLSTTILLFSFSSKALEKNEYFHNIYKDNYSQTTDNFESILSEADVERSYVIQRGDTLYDISDTLFGSPSFWPKIWSLNPSLGNPHLIIQGNQIVFSESSLETAPQFAIGDKEEGETDLNAKLNNTTSVQTTSSELSKIVIPPPYKKNARPIALPKSLPRLLTALEEEEDLNSVSSLKMNQRNSYHAPLIFKPRSFITTRLPSSIGKVKGIFRGGQNATLGETIIIKSTENLSLGDKLVSYQNSGLKRTEGSVGSNTYLIKRTGVLRIDKPLGKSKYLAEVVESYGFVSKGNKLYLGTLEDIIVSKNSTPTSLATSKKVEILGGEFELGREILGIGDIVYLSKGRNANIEMNQLYLVYTNRAKKVAEYNSRLAKNMPVSFAKIIDVQDKVSTAVLVENVDEVSSEDYLNIR